MKFSATVKPAGGAIVTVPDWVVVLVLVTTTGTSRLPPVGSVSTGMTVPLSCGTPA